MPWWWVSSGCESSAGMQRLEVELWPMTRNKKPKKVKMNKLVKTTIGLTACLGVSAISYAAVVLNEDYTGFVGKGDVQTVCGGNNKALQSYANDVTFSYESAISYLVTCEWSNTVGKDNELKWHQVDQSASTTIAAVLDGDPRQTKGQKQFTGFLLLGASSTEESGEELPEIGATDWCPGSGTENNASGKIVIAIEIVEGSDVAGLAVHCPDNSPNPGSWLLEVE
jgi:hypothetical protein